MSKADVGRTLRVRLASLTRLAPRAVIVGVLLMGGCATRTAPPALPATLRYPEFMYPALPAAYSNPDAAAQIERGWRYLQNNDLGGAEREFTVAAKLTPGLYPAQAGSAYVALARTDHDQALSRFDAALRAAPAYVPALVGRGQTLLALKRDTDALAAFEAALAADASLADVRRRVDVLRFRSLEDVIETGRTAAAAGRLAEARDAYQRALRASPDSAFLHRELGLLERRQGNTDAALERFRRRAPEPLERRIGVALLALEQAELPVEERAVGRRLQRPLIGIAGLGQPSRGGRRARRLRSRPAGCGTAARPRGGGRPPARRRRPARLRRRRARRCRASAPAASARGRRAPARTRARHAAPRRSRSAPARDRCAPAPRRPSPPAPDTGRASASRHAANSRSALPRSLFCR